MHYERIRECPSVNPQSVVEENDGFLLLDFDFKAKSRDN